MVIIITKIIINKSGTTSCEASALLGVAGKDGPVPGYLGAYMNKCRVQKAEPRYSLSSLGPVNSRCSKWVSV